MDSDHSGLIIAPEATTYEIAETAAWLVWKLLAWGVLGPPVGLKIAVWFDCKLLSVVMYRLIK